MPGLVRRRAAEQALFLKGTSSAKEETRPEVETPIGKSMTMSTTNIAAGATATAGVVATVKETVDNGKHIFTGLDVNLVLIAIILAGAGWIIYQRYRKARDWDV